MNWFVLQNCAQIYIACAHVHVKDVHVGTCYIHAHKLSAFSIVYIVFIAYSYFVYSSAFDNRVVMLMLYFAVICSLCYCVYSPIVHFAFAFLCYTSYKILARNKPVSIFF